MGLVVHKYRGPRKSLLGAFIALWFSLRLHGALPHTPIRPIHIIVIALNTLLSLAACGGVGRVGTPEVAGVRLGLEAI